jgi:putative flavoprotein involved in K+ transport
VFARARPGLKERAGCTGFRPDFSWIELPVLGLDGYPAHRRGIARDAPGLSFLGMRYQFRMGSALIGGVGEDAEYVVGQTVQFLRSKATAAAGSSAKGGAICVTEAKQL